MSLSLYGVPDGQQKGQSAWPCPSVYSPTTALGSLSSVALSSAPAFVTLAQTRKPDANYHHFRARIWSGFLGEATNHIWSGFLGEAIRSITRLIAKNNTDQLNPNAIHDIIVVVDRRVREVNPKILWLHLTGCLNRITVSLLQPDK